MIDRMVSCKVCGKNHRVTIGDGDKARSAMHNEDIQRVGTLLDASFVARLKDRAGGGDILRDMLKLSGIDTNKEFFTFTHDQCGDTAPVIEYWQPQEWPEERLA